MIGVELFGYSASKLFPEGAFYSNSDVITICPQRQFEEKQDLYHVL